MSTDTGDKVPHSRATAITVAVGLTIICVVSISGIVIVSVLSYEVPAILAAVAGAAVGALGGHLGAIGMRKSEADGAATRIR